MYTEQPGDPYPGIPELDTVSVDQDLSSANIFYNRITGFTIGIQMEGDNKGAYDPTLDSLAGLGLLVECNDLYNSYENWYFDMVVVGNYYDDGYTYQGKLRDIGDCNDVNLQAGNTFSPCWSNGQWKDHFYYDFNCELDSFRYSDQETKLPDVTCTNLVPYMQRNPCAGFLGERACESTLECDAPCLYEKRRLLRQRIDSLNTLLNEPEEEALDRDALYKLRAALRAHERQLHNAELRLYLEAENPDSLLAVIMRDQSGSQHRDKLYYLIEKGEYAAADSLIQLIIAMEGGVASAHTQLQMLRLSMLQGLQTPENLNNSQRVLLNAMITADPQGAASAKALLAAAFGHRYQRVPWRLNDVAPGRSVVRSETPRTGIRLWPNPTSDMFQIECASPIDAVLIHDASGRLTRSFKLNGVSLFTWDHNDLVPGAYAVHALTRAGPQSAILVIVP